MDPVLAEDAAQQAMLRAWKHCSKAPHGDPAPWVRVIARREALRILGRRRELPVEEAAGPVARSEPVDYALERLLLLDAVRTLSDNERLAVLMHYWGDLSQASIAVAMQVPLGTIKIRIHRAKAKLNAALRESQDPIVLGAWRQNPND